MVRRAAPAVLLMVLVAGCGHTRRPAAAEARCGTPTSPRACVAVDFTDLRTVLLLWPQAEHAYRDHDRFDIDTSLPRTGAARAVDICSSAFDELASDGVRDPRIRVWSRGGRLLAADRAGDAGCTPT